MINRVIISISVIINVLLIGFLVYYFTTRTEDKLKSVKIHEKKNYFSNPFKKSDLEKLKTYIDNGSVLIVDHNGKTLLDYNGDERYIPASTLKIVTSLAAIHYLGKDYRFKTEFKLDSKNNLYIKGFGDPSLTSNELRLVVYGLFKKGLRKINSIYVDGSFFNDFVKVPGNENSFEAYDAKNSALAANFNTIAYKREGNQILSGEAETPFVAYAKKIFNKVELEENKKFKGRVYNCNASILYELADNRLKPKRKFRITIKDENDSLLYFGNLFKEICKDFSINVLGDIEIKQSPSELPLLLRYESSKTLSDVVKHLLKYSNNFTANQILLTLGAIKSGSNPASLKKGISVLDKYLKEELDIKNMFISEGSGLSYANRVTARQMIKLLNHFKPYKHLLNKILMKRYRNVKSLDIARDSVFAKSGGLKTVNSLVGFMNTKFGEVKFAIYLNQSANNKLHILKLLMSSLY
ncbi:MAG: D-alanyl-D-alanine carboxypeptidase/D-alanyl-D-alanine-endopeptidase [Spirochaetota bacterium]|nr:D-alanyl-D-alanine carboxypeptidase/D-alanyl-D-alanine-endopeptidase [Spirochaetota bacterium]